MDKNHSGSERRIYEESSVQDEDEQNEDDVEERNDEEENEDMKRTDGDPSSSNIIESDEAGTSGFRNDKQTTSSDSLMLVQHDEEMIAVNFVPIDTPRYVSSGSYDLLCTRNIRLALTTLNRRQNVSRLNDLEDNLTPANINPCLNYEQKTNELLQFITRNSKVADIKLCFYIVACEEQQILKPFPNHLVEESEQGNKRLMLINEEIPCIRLLHGYLSQNRIFKVSEGVVSLLHWLFVSLQDPKLKCIPPENFFDIFNKVDGASNFEQTSYLCRVMYGRSSPFEIKWQALKGNRKSKFAFYSNKLNMMHALLHLGFHPSAKTHGLYGSGIYLFADLKKTMEYSGPGWAWGKSEIGTQFKIVLIVEFLDDPDVQIYNRFENTNQLSLMIGSHEEEMIGYFIPRPELLRIRYVCIFVKTAAPSAPTTPRQSQRLFSSLKHKRIASLFGTIILTYATTQYLSSAITASSEYFIQIQKKVYGIE